MEPDDVALEAESEGGRHHGKYADAMKWKPSSIRKAARSYQATVEEHMRKLEAPAEHDAAWDRKDERQRAGLLKKWRTDARKNAELLAVIRLVAKRRGVDLNV